MVEEKKIEATLTDRKEIRYKDGLKNKKRAKELIEKHIDDEDLTEIKLTKTHTAIIMESYDTK